MTGAEPVTYEWVSAVGTLISVANLIALGTLLFKFGQWMGKVDTRWAVREESEAKALAAREKVEAERHEEQVERLERLEKKVGISNGGAPWVDREFCRDVHVAFSLEVARMEKGQAALAEKVEKAMEDGREAIRIGHEDRMAIKQRLTAVEVALTKK